MPLTIRPTAAIDVPFVLAAERAEHAREYVIPWSEGQHAQAILDEDQEHLLVRLDGELFGFVLLAGLVSSPHSIELRRIVVTKAGVGLGRQAMQLVLARVFDSVHAHRVWLDVKPRNARARRCYSSLGFVEEGILRDVLLVDGCRESLILMSLLRPEWESQ